MDGLDTSLLVIFVVFLAVLYYFRVEGSTAAVQKNWRRLGGAMEKSELKELTKLVAIVTFTIARVILQLSFISIHKTIHKMSKTQTVNQEITPSFIGDPIKISLTIPTAKPVLDGRNKVPITVHLSKTGGNARFGAYVYSIYDVCILL